MILSLDTSQGRKGKISFPSLMLYIYFSILNKWAPGADSREVTLILRYTVCVKHCANSFITVRDDESNSNHHLLCLFLVSTVHYLTQHFQQLFQADPMMIPILQMRKLRWDWLINKFSKWQRWYSNLGPLDTEAMSCWLHHNYELSTDLWLPESHGCHALTRYRLSGWGQISHAAAGCPD